MSAIGLLGDIKLLGIKAPAFIWYGALLLIAFTAIILLRLVYLVWREQRAHRNLARSIDQLTERFPRQPGEGLSMEAFDELRQVFENRRQFQMAWKTYQAQILLEPSREGEDQHWAPESAGSSFNEGSVIEPRVNRSFYVAVPGLVTGLGLLLTFVAILFALLEVRVEKDQVVGLEGLVAGLSGKFVSSVCALLAASVFLFIERILLHRLGDSRRNLVDSLDGLVPRRTAQHVLADLHRDIQEQSIAFRHFNVDLSGRLKQSFSDSMGESMRPILDRMTTSIEDLNTIMRAAEAAKQESITGSLEALLQNLDRSMRSTLQQMGDRFAESLAGGATQQFDEVTRSLSGAARLLEGMNSQFQNTQTALTHVVEMARSSTAEQMSLGKAQISELSEVLRALMAQLQESTGSSVATMNAALATVLQDLSSKVLELGNRMGATMEQSAGHAAAAATGAVEQARTLSQQNASQFHQLIEQQSTQMNRLDDLGRSQVAELTSTMRGLMGEIQQTTGASMVNMNTALTTMMQDLSERVSQLGVQMAAAMEQSAGHAAAAATGAVDNARQLSERTAAQLTELLERHSAQVQRLDDLRRTLDVTLTGFHEATNQYGNVTSNLQVTAREVAAVASRAAEAVETIRQTQASLQIVAQHSASQVEHLVEADRHQEVTWTRIQASLDQYESSFRRVETAASDLLTQLAGHLTQYTQTTRGSFEHLVQVSNEHIGTATQRLGSSINELEEYLSELSDVLSRSQSKLRA